MFQNLCSRTLTGVLRQQHDPFPDVVVAKTSEPVQVRREVVVRLPIKPLKYIDKLTVAYRPDESVEGDRSPLGLILEALQVGR